MNRISTILVILLAASSAFGQQGGPRSLAGQQTDTAEEPQAQLQRSVTQLYVFGLQNEVGLSDGQFLKARQTIQQFIGMRFRYANQKRTLDERENQLLSQPNASESDIQKLNEDANKLALETANWEGRLVKRLQTDLGTDQQLSDRQIALLRSYNRRFFTERLPSVVEQMRKGDLPLKGQRPANARGNQNQRGQAAAPANTLRGRDVPPPVQPPRKLAR